MSRTRRAEDGQPVAQERFASSVELRGGALLGNLVARRAAVLPTEELRALAHFIQDVSQRVGLVTHQTCSQFPAWGPWAKAPNVGTDGLDRLAREIVFREGGTLTIGKVAKAKKWLARFALDPGFNPEHPVRFLPNALASLRSVYRDHIREAQERVAPTTVSTLVSECLTYAVEQRGLVVIEGVYRTGKSISAQAWTMANIGRARYCQLSSSRDEASFFRQIARAVGVAAATSRKAADMRERIETTLRQQQLALVIDDAQFIWPQTARPRDVPHRLAWVLTALCNAGVPVALVATRDFTRLLKTVERHVHVYGLEQFWGRLRLWQDLPDELDLDDLKAIARHMAPEADDATHLLLAGHALKHSGYVATMESAVARARFIAQKEGRSIEFEDVENAVSEISGTHVKRRMREASNATPSASRSGCEGVASFPRPGRGLSPTTRVAKAPALVG